MKSIWLILLSCAFISFVAAQYATSDKLVGYIPGVAGMPPINETNCQNEVLEQNPFLSNALECSRICHAGDKPKTCYYQFVVERYPIFGEACDFCMPNVASNGICPECQCVPGDGVERMALVINRMLPGPSIEVCEGDYVVVDVLNQIAENALTIHWHGVFQKDYQYYDGVPMITQCPIQPFTTFRYQFRANNPGTHFYHSHVGLTKLDGLFGHLIIREPVERDPNIDYFDTDLSSHVVSIHDWLHEAGTDRDPGRSRGNPTELPDTFLINGKGQFTFPNGTTTTTPLEVLTVEPNKRHRFRLINAFCTICPSELTIEGHNLTVLASDGQNIKPIPVTSIVSLAGERFDFVIETNQTPGAYWIQLRGLDLCANLGTQQLAKLQYVNASQDTETSPPTAQDGLPRGVVLNPLDVSCQTPDPKAICIDALKSTEPAEEGIMKPEADYKFYIPVGFHTFQAEELYEPNQYTSFLTVAPGVNVEAMLSGIRYEFPPSPMLSQPEDIPPGVICDPDNLPLSCNANETCRCANTLKAALNSTVELILVDVSRAEMLTHPFHLHGYAFKVMDMAQPFGPYSNTGETTNITVDYVKQLDREGLIDRRFTLPPGKDTLAVPNNGYVVLRFVANNAGVWLFHCHFLFHQDHGMTLTVQIGEQSDLPPVPLNFPRCGDFIPAIADEKHTRSRRRPRKFFHGPIGRFLDNRFL